MKVAIIGPDCSFKGGIAHYNSQLLREFSNQGHNLLFISFKSMYPSFAFPSSSGNLSGNSFKPEKNTCFQKLLHWASPLSFLKAAKIINEFNPSLVVTHLWTGALGFHTAFLLSKIKKGRIAVIIHNVACHEKTMIHNFLLSLSLKAVLKYSDSAILQSESEKSLLEKTADFKTDIKVVSHPVYKQFSSSLSSFEARRKLNLPEKGKIVLFFGISRYYKGSDLFAEAVSKTPELTGIIAGEVWSRSMRKKFRNMKKRYKNFYLFDGYLPEKKVSILFAAADALVLPYRSVTGSGVAMAAVGARKPVICSELPVFMDIFPPECRFAFKPGDTEGLIVALNSFLSKDKLNCRTVFDTIAEENGWNVLVNRIKEDVCISGKDSVC